MVPLFLTLPEVVNSPVKLTSPSLVKFPFTLASEVTLIALLSKFFTSWLSNVLSASSTLALLKVIDCLNVASCSLIAHLPCISNFSKPSYLFIPASTSLSSLFLSLLTTRVSSLPLASNLPSIFVFSLTITRVGADFLLICEFIRVSPEYSE